MQKAFYFTYKYVSTKYKGQNVLKHSAQLLKPAAKIFWTLFVIKLLSQFVTLFHNK